MKIQPWHSEYYTGSALFSDCQKYRFQLDRQWYKNTSDRRLVVFVMLNPSTADALKDDLTIRKCVSIAGHNKFTALTVLNLSPFRATSPKVLQSYLKARVNKGLDVVDINLKVWGEVLSEAQSIVVAWGNHAKMLDQTESRNPVKNGMFALLLSPGNLEKIHFLNMTKKGNPTHPLYQKSDCKIKPLSNMRECLTPIKE